jgi:hypothetical protein
MIWVVNPIPDPGSRGQEGPGSRIRIRKTVLTFLGSGAERWQAVPAGGRRGACGGRGAAGRPPGRTLLPGLPHSGRGQGAPLQVAREEAAGNALALWQEHQ